MTVKAFFDKVVAGEIQGSVKQAYAKFCTDNGFKHSPKNFTTYVYQARKRKQK